LTFGPTVKGSALFGLDTNVQFTFGPSPAFTFAATGTLDAGQTALGTGTVMVTNNGANLNLTLGVGPDGLTFFRKHISVTGSVNGTFAAGTVSASGQAQLNVTLFGQTDSVAGQVAINQNGMGACASIDSGRLDGSYGFTWNWGSTPKEQLGTCNIAAY
jgi:hypothetical protein